MELWIPVTVAAAFLQNTRTALQKHLGGRMTTLGATFARFVLGVPFAALYLWLVSAFTGQAMPSPGPAFAGYVAVGGMAQIVATVCLLNAFHYRNFAVGTAYSKTEAVQAALIAFLVLGESLSVAAVAGILISLAGVMTISAAKQRLSARSLVVGWTEKPALYGLASGALFGTAAVCFRGASLSLESGDFLIRAALTLFCALVLQTLAMGVHLLLRHPDQVVAVFRHWRWTGPVGLTGMLGSACWFTAMTLQSAAYVRALGQVELLFTFVASTLVFRERTTPVELAGIAAVVGGILLVLLG